MVFKESSYFFIKPCGAQLLSRLAPGISVSFAITFMPVQHEDYIHRVTFHTDTDQYALPLIGKIIIDNVLLQENIIKRLFLTFWDMKKSFTCIHRF